MEVDQEAKPQQSSLKDPQALFKQCLSTVVNKKWASLFHVRQDLQRLQDVLLPAATNLTDSQKQQLNGDAFFLLIGFTLAENVHQISSLNQKDTVIGVDALKQKFFEPLFQVV